MDLWKAPDHFIDDLRRTTLLRCILLISATLFASTFAFSDSISFSGSFSSSFGVIPADTTFSGVATWDPSTIGAVIPDTAELTSLTLNLSPNAGLSNNAPIPNAGVVFAGAKYTGTTFDFVQVNDVSAVDGNAYTFFFGPTSGAGDASVTNGDFTLSELASSYTVEASTIPEPSSLMLFGSGLAGLVALPRRKLLSIRRRSR